VCACANRTEKRNFGAPLFSFDYKDAKPESLGVDSLRVNCSGATILLSLSLKKGSMPEYTTPDQY
jgi:hypothetical protein